ncbi:MAG: hypothetical protein U0232_02920 [Thermomicrobiales bacterium]
MTNLSATLATVAKAARLRYALLFLALLVALYWTGIRPWMANWGSTAAEQQLVLPGDELHQDRTGQSTLAITIDAPPEVVWQWLVQVGQDRAGFYSYTWLENLFGSDIHNTDELRPEWQHLAVGDSWRLVPRDYLWGLGEGAATPVLLVEPGHALVLEMWGAFVIEPIDEHTSRLLVRGQTESSGLVASLMSKALMDPMVFTMERRMLLGIKARAEGQPESPAALATIAQLGWAAAGVAVAWLFARQRRRRYWLALPVVAALPALLMARDAQAGLAAFLAVGITALGFLAYGRHWWGPLLVIGPVVMLTLLLAPDAYVAIGLAFILLPLAASGALVAARPGARVGGPQRTFTPTPSR